MCVLLQNIHLLNVAKEPTYFPEALLKHSNKRGTSVGSGNKKAGRPGTNYSKTRILEEIAFSNWIA